MLRLTFPVSLPVRPDSSTDFGGAIYSLVFTYLPTFKNVAVHCSDCSLKMINYQCQYCNEFVMVTWCVYVSLCMWVCMLCGVWVDYCQIHDEEPLPLSVFIHHANDVVWRHGLAHRESDSPSLV